MSHIFKIVLDSIDKQETSDKNMEKQISRTLVVTSICCPMPLIFHCPENVYCIYSN